MIFDVALKAQVTKGKIKWDYVKLKKLLHNKGDKYEIRIVKRYLHSHVHSNIIHNSQDMKTT